jgi:hypothetical protein
VSLPLELSRRNRARGHRNRLNRGQGTHGHGRRVCRSRILILGRGSNATRRCRFRTRNGESACRPAVAFAALKTGQAGEGPLERNFAGFCCVNQRVGCFSFARRAGPVMRDAFAVRQRECGSSGVRERCPEVLPGNTLECIFGTRRQNMITFLALWLCVLSVVAIYCTIPPRGMRPDIYGIALWILSSCTLATSTIIIVVGLVSPQAIHPN